MYTNCQNCRRSFGRNRTVTHMPVGRRLAYDAKCGRLWIVCRLCQQWNLTPLDVRWEAIEECESLFAAAEVQVAHRAKSGTVGIAQVGDVELLRLGDAPRDEIANARYGPRLLRRQVRRRRLATVAGVMLGALAGGLILAASAEGSIGATAYVGAISLYFFYWFGTAAGRLRLVRFQREDRSSVWLTAHDLRTAAVPPHARHARELSTDLALRTGRGIERFNRDAALAPLAAILPALNAEGADQETISAAVGMVDEVEDAVKRNAKPPNLLVDSQGRAAWQRLLQGPKRADAELADRTLVERLALEMAVAEELERRALQKDAAGMTPRAESESEIAAIADDMFLPRGILDWIERYKTRSKRLA